MTAPNTSQWASRIPDVVARQLPYAARLAVNATATGLQAAQLTEQAKRFTIRRPQFARLSLKVTFAKSGELTSRVGYADLGGQPTSDMWTQHEPGTIKRPRQGRSIAVPVNVRRTKRDLISAANRPRALLDKSGRTFVADDGTDRVIVQRRGRGKSSSTVVLYELKRQVALRPRLGFAGFARAYVGRTLPREVQAGLAKALASARWDGGRRTASVASSLPR